MRLWRRTGTRVLALQALALAAALTVAFALARTAIQRTDEQFIRAQVAGETASLDDEWRHKGLAHLRHTIGKRSRLWHGFDYGLASPAGAVLAGEPTLAQARRAGWSRRPSSAGVDLAYTETLPDGEQLSVGENLAEERRTLRMLTWLFALSGAAGVAVCLTIAYLTTRWTWRRLDGLSTTAALVAEGRLDVRAPVRRHRAPDEIDEASLAFNAMLDRIGRLVDQLRRVTTDVAHDMRRPLNRLRQKLERLGRRTEASPALAEAVARLDGEFVEILRTFDALLQLADIEGGAHPDGLVDLGDVAHRVSEALGPDIEQSGRFLEVACAPATVRGDADLVVQALANLMENALRHTPPGARIQLRVERSGAAARLVVRDDGPGIAAELRETALAPFGRLEASRSTPGSGLGLAITASIAVRHGARLDLADAEPGLEASISFPAVRG